MRPVAYRPIDPERASGLELADGELHAYADGALAGSASVPAGATLKELLSGYRAVELLSGVEFSLSGERREMDLQISVQTAFPGSLSGVVESGERRAFWEALREGDVAFTRADRLPAGARPWAAGERPGYGWAIGLPVFLLEEDPVLRQRAALAIEAFIYAVASGREIAFPYRRRITNVFSAKRPTWDEPLPLIREVRP